MKNKIIIYSAKKRTSRKNKSRTKVLSVDEKNRDF